MILSMNETLEKISEFVNKCLGPLGTDGFSWDNIRDFIIQLGATLILFLIIRFYLWKPITNMLETRRNAMDKEIDEAKENNLKSRKLTRELEEKLEAAQFEVKNIIDKAENDANLRRNQIIKEAKEEAKKRLEAVESDIEQEILKSNAEIHKMIVDVAFLAAKKIVGNEIDQDKYLDIVNEIIEGASK